MLSVHRFVARVVAFIFALLSTALAASSNVTLCFHTNQAGERGLEIAIYDYAHFSEVYYEVTSVILWPKVPAVTEGLSYPKFERRFRIVLYDVDPPNRPSGGRNLWTKAQEAGCQFVYIAKAGTRKSDPSMETTLRFATLPYGIHSVFFWDPHGQVYAAISEDITDAVPDRAVVHHIVRAANLTEFRQRSGFRQALGIPQDALVLCRHGGRDSFDIKFVFQEVWNSLSRHDAQHLHYLFMNTDEFTWKGPLHASKRGNKGRVDDEEKKVNNTQTAHSNATSSSESLRQFLAKHSTALHPQLHFLPPSIDYHIKEEFLRGCDAMLHARRIGETFGLAIAEFSVHNLPVISYVEGTVGNSRIGLEHVRILGEKGFFFQNAEQLQYWIDTFVQTKSKRGSVQLLKAHFYPNLINFTAAADVTEEKQDFNAYRQFAPEPIMAAFMSTFVETATKLKMVKRAHPLQIN